MLLIKVTLPYGRNIVYLFKVITYWYGRQKYLPNTITKEENTMKQYTERIRSFAMSKNVIEPDLGIIVKRSNQVQNIDENISNGTTYLPNIATFVKAIPNPMQAYSLDEKHKELKVFVATYDDTFPNRRVAPDYKYKFSGKNDDKQLQVILDSNALIAREVNREYALCSYASMNPGLGSSVILQCALASSLLELTLQSNEHINSRTPTVIMLQEDQVDLNAYWEKHSLVIKNTDPEKTINDCKNNVFMYTHAVVPVLEKLGYTKVVQ